MNRAIEGFSLYLTGPTGLGIEYMATLSGMYDSCWESNGAYVGTRGQSRPIEGFAVRLTGPLASMYEVFYMAHVEGQDLPPVSHGAYCGHRARRVHGLRVWVEPATSSSLPGCSPCTVISNPTMVPPPGPMPGYPLNNPGTYPAPYPGMVVPPISMQPGSMPGSMPPMMVNPATYPGMVAPPVSMPPVSMPPRSFPGSVMYPGAIPVSPPMMVSPTVMVPSSEPLDVFGTVHLQDIGDRPFYKSEFAGLRYQGKRLEGFSLQLSCLFNGINIEYMAQQDNMRDSPWRSSGQFVGSRGKSRKLYGFAVRLTGPGAGQYNVKYMAHIAGQDSPVFSNGMYCGGHGPAPLEGFRIWVEPKW